MEESNWGVPWKWRGKSWQDEIWREVFPSAGTFGMNWLRYSIIILCRLSWIREPHEASEFSLLKFSFTNIPCMINDISVAKPFSQSRAAQEVALLDTVNLFVLGNKWKELPKKTEHCPLMWSNTSEERSGEVDFFYNNETLKIDGRLPFVTEPIVTSYNVPSQGSEKCTMGDEMKGSW